MERDPSEGDLQEQVALYQATGNPELAEALLASCRPMIAMAARKLSRSRPDLEEDLFQVGQMSLLKTIKQFDAAMGTPFEGYAMKSLVGYMKNYLRDKSWYIQVPRRIKEIGAKLQRAIDELTAELQRSPDIGEIAGRLGLTEEETMEALAGRDYYQPVSLDVPLNSSEDDHRAFVEILAAADDAYDQAETRMDLARAAEQLDDAERRVMHYIFYEGLPQRLAAEKLGVSQMSVSRLQRRLIGKLKQSLGGREGQAGKEEERSEYGG